MCTFKDERTVEVCDVAIERVRQTIDPVFGGQVRYTHVDGRPTLVEAMSGVDGEVFAAQVRSAIDSVP
jgi:hypothetical protein